MVPFKHPAWYRVGTLQDKSQEARDMEHLAWWELSRVYCLVHPKTSPSATVGSGEE
jgi:hypothetical protein